MQDQIRRNKRIRKIWLAFLVFSTFVLTLWLFGIFHLFQFGIPFLGIGSEDSIQVNFAQDVPPWNGFSVKRGQLTINWKDIENAPFPYNFLDDPLPPHMRRNISYVVGGEKEILVFEEVNSLGLRGEEISVNKPNNTFRILVLGDSFVFGIGLKNNQTSSVYLEKELKDKRAGIGFEVINLGVPGYNTKNEIRRLKLKGLQLHPDLVILAYVDNDIENAELISKLDWYSLNFLMSFLNFSDSEAWNFRLNQIGPKFQKRYFLGKDFDSLWKKVETSISELHNLSDAYGFDVIILSYPAPFQHIQRLEKQSKEFGWQFYPLEKDMGFENKLPWILDPSNVHPSAYGNQKLAEFLTQIILRDFVTPI